MAKLLGYQIADENGVNIQGDDDCPADYASFEILSPQVALTVMEDIMSTDLVGRYLLMPILEGEIEEYTLIE